MEQIDAVRSFEMPVGCSSSLQFEKYELFCHSLGKKWRIRILGMLAYGSELRYAELKRSLSPITHKILSDELSALTDLGLISRRECGGVPVKVVYSLTGSGQELLYHFAHFADWIDSISA